MAHSNGAMAHSNGALPTLLCSRPVACDAPEPAKSRRRRPQPAALELPEEAALAPQAPGLDAPQGLRVKNTFIEGDALLSPSLESFYRERVVHTCPSKHAGRCLSLLEELAREMPDTSARTPLNIDTPCSIRTPLGDDCAQGQPCYEVCESPCAYPSYAPLGHGGVHTGLPADAVRVPPGAESLSLVPVTHGPSSESRMVLSLAEALEQGGGLEVRAGVLEHLPQYAAPALEESARAGRPPTGPALGFLELPSLGSAGHAAGRCRPCAFLHTKGCENDLACQFCHLCGPEVRKARRQDKLQLRREAHRARREGPAVRHYRSM